MKLQVEFNLIPPTGARTIVLKTGRKEPLKKTRWRAVNVGRGTEELALDYPLPKVILEYRGLAKLKIDLHRQAAADDQPEDRACAYLLSPGSNCNGTFIVRPMPDLQNIPVH
ncbi:hypothetical protein ACLB1Q_20825 [Escherichia coli]